jgi:putative transcriptional regulator
MTFRKRSDAKLSKGSNSPLERLRERVDLTQEELCRRCGIPLQTYARWVAGDGVSRPNIPQIKALCRELGISIEELPDEFGPSERSPSPEK